MEIRVTTYDGDPMLYLVADSGIFPNRDIPVIWTEDPLPVGTVNKNHAGALVLHFFQPGNKEDYKLAAVFDGQGLVEKILITWTPPRPVHPIPPGA